MPVPKPFFARTIDKENHAESLGHGKQKLMDIINKANRIRRGNRRGNIRIGELYEPKGKEVDLEKLKCLSSFLNFRNALIEELKDLGELEHDYTI